MGTRVMYPLEVKLRAIEMKKQGYTAKEIMSALNIKNETQVWTWWRWHRNNEHHRFEQAVGKQYAFGFGPNDLSVDERKDNHIKFLEQQIDVLKKYIALERSWSHKLSSK